MDTYGILAYPAKHSLSPKIHNAAFKELRIKADYVIFEVKPEKFEEFMKNIKNSKIKGLSVSLPYKERVKDYLDGISVEAKEIGAINTISKVEDKLLGENTDWEGAMMALKEVTELKGKKILLLGARGAGMAIGFGLKKELGSNLDLTIWNRTRERAEFLAKYLSVNTLDGHPLDLKKKNEFDIIINTTSVGMNGFKEEESLIKGEAWNKNMIAFEAIYSPLKTKFIKDAINLGAKTVTGEKMLLYQGVKQFELWTGEKAPINLMKKVLANSLFTN